MERSVSNFACQRGLPFEDQLEDYTRDGHYRLIVIAYLMYEVVRNQDMELLFTQGCHQRNLSVIFITQFHFPRGKHTRTIASNTWCMVLMKTVRDATHVSVLARQLFPGNAQGFMRAYQDALEGNYGYLVVDTSPRGNDQRHLRTRIFPGENPIVCRLKES